MRPRGLSEVGDASTNTTRISQTAHAGTADTHNPRPLDRVHFPQPSSARCPARIVVATESPLRSPSLTGRGSPSAADRAVSESTGAESSSCPVLHQAPRRPSSLLGRLNLFSGFFYLSFFFFFFYFFLFSFLSVVLGVSGGDSFHLIGAADWAVLGRGVGKGRGRRRQAAGYLLTSGPWRPAGSGHSAAHTTGREARACRQSAALLFRRHRSSTMGWNGADWDPL